MRSHRDVPSTVPAHLRQYVVEQDYAQYTEVDHAVWRFVLLGTYARLRHTAHSAYRSGLADTGISVERIPHIEEMNERLGRFGWSAVSVDGFIPPRAFQTFQANGILPIAAEIRTAEHLAYTPAPDIIHEAAGHAPILSDPAYARYLRRIGSVAEKTFARPADRNVYRAIHTLSEVKEDPNARDEQVKRAEQALEQALAGLGEPSESAKLARLYWWTAEYGLVGTPADYRLYGAGLLSSLYESHSCHDPRVEKRVLSAACIDVDYDITRAQPQLFVARDFDHLEEVLDEVAGTMAHRVGGESAIDSARSSEELATLELDEGLEAFGTVTEIVRVDGTSRVIELEGDVAFAHRGRLLDRLGRWSGAILALGHRSDGRALSRMTREDLDACSDGARLELRLRGGIRISSSRWKAHEEDGRVLVLLLEDLEIELSDGRLFRSASVHPMALASHVITARAGAPPEYFPSTAPSSARVPSPRWLSPRERARTDLYDRAVEAFRSLSGSAVVPVFERLASELDAEFPDEWLLRWNLLESLVKLGEGEALATKLEDELEALEIRFAHREPIAMGLAYLRSITAPGLTQGRETS